MSKNNNEIKHEDLIMKKAMDVFAEEGLKFFWNKPKSKRLKFNRNSSFRGFESSYGLYFLDGR